MSQIVKDSGITRETLYKVLQPDSEPRINPLASSFWKTHSGKRKKPSPSAIVSAFRLSKDLARHPVPVMLLARLAVNTGWQGRGAGAGLLKDAMRRTVQAADIAGIRAFVVHAKNDTAQAFYEHFGFISSPTDPLHLYVLIKELTGQFRRTRRGG